MSFFWNDAIVLADMPANEVVQNDPDAVLPPGVGLNVVAAEQPVPEILETGNTNKLT